VDLSPTALPQAAAHGVAAVRGDVLHVPLADGVADVVCAGEILEHVPDLPRAVAEACRILRPGGVLVLDTIARTRLADVLAVRIGERLRQAPRGIHDPALFVDRAELVAEAARHGVPLRLRGLRPSAGAVLAWSAGRASRTGMVPTRSTAVLFQGYGVKESR
jgi:2-polyprenyl-6-hydroxyphenyl methylase/3-demethylubiquinone-9 3-methyltransferase